jgi:hypothetical protein
LLQRKPPRNAPEPTGNVNDVPAPEPAVNVNDAPVPAPTQVNATAPATGIRSQPKKSQPAKRSQPASASAPKVVNGSSTVVHGAPNANAPATAPAPTAVNDAPKANAPFKPPNKVHSCININLDILDYKFFYTLK